MNYSHVFWDWNGTLLDDVDWCMEQMNKMLAVRNKDPIRSRTEYHDVFCFPVIDYYKKVGFDFVDEPFDVLAKEYIALYHGEGSGNLTLHDDALMVLDYIRAKNVTQVILSASSRDNLTQQLSMFPIDGYFSEVLGTSDIYANSKVDVGKQYIAGANVDRAVLVGDTVHDYEVSKALGMDCLLVARGHQDWATLRSCNVPVLRNLTEVLDLLEGKWSFPFWKQPLNIRNPNT